MTITQLKTEIFKAIQINKQALVLNDKIDNRTIELLKTPRPLKFKQPLIQPLLAHGQIFLPLKVCGAKYKITLKYP